MTSLIRIAALAAFALGLAGMKYGAEDDSPGLVLLCGLLIVGTAAATARREYVLARGRSGHPLQHVAVLPLRVVLALTFAALLMLQTFSIPGQFAHMAKEEPSFRDERWPLLVVILLGLACVQVVIVSVWRLLTLVTKGRIFSPVAFGWVDAIIGAIATAWLLLFGLGAWFAPEFDDPGVPVILTVMLLVGAVLGLLMVVMRALLVQAATLQADMDEVI